MPLDMALRSIVTVKVTNIDNLTIIVYNVCCKEAGYAVRKAV